MSDNKKYLNDLKEELSHYQKKLSEIKKSFKGKTDKDAEKIYDSLHRIFKEAGESYQSLEAASVEEWGPLKKIAVQSFNELKNSFDELKDSMTKQALDYSHQIEEYSQEQLDLSAEYIKENPFKSILLAGGLGFIIGRILK